MWDLDSWSLDTGLKSHALPDLPEPTQAAAFSRTGGWFAMGGGTENPSGTCKFKLFQIPITSEPVCPGQFTHAISSVAFSPSGDTIAIAGSDRDKPGDLSLWNVHPLSLKGRLQGHEYLVTSVVFTEDGQSIISASGAGLTHQAGDIKIWDPATLHERATLAKFFHPINALAFSSQARMLAAVAGDSSLIVFRGASDADVLANTEGALRAFPGDPDTVVNYTRACWSYCTGRANADRRCLLQARKAIAGLTREGSQRSELLKWKVLLETEEQRFGSAR
jgi:hypothetical protein